MAQTRLTWEVLAKLKVEKVFMQEMDSYINKPTFSKEVLAMHGKEVVLTGYIIPVDPESDFYVLSSNPYASCFFCGGAGPETVVDLKFKKRDKLYKTDEVHSFKGKFKVNADDLLNLYYSLEDVVPFK